MPLTSDPAVSRPGEGPVAEDAMLSPVEVAILDFERTLWRRAAAKDDAIRVRFGISPTTYYVTLSRLIETDAAMAHDPLLVQRLRRRIAQRARQTPEGVR